MNTKLFFNELLYIRKIAPEIFCDFLEKFLSNKELSSDNKSNKFLLDMFDECFMQLPKDVRCFLERIYKNIDVSNGFELYDSFNFSKKHISDEELIDESYSFFFYK